ARARRKVMRQLVERQALKTMLALQASEADEGLLSEWNHHIDDVVMKRVPQLIVDGDDGEAGRLLEMAATYDDGMRHWATYLLLTGRIDDKIAELRNSQDTSAIGAKRLAYALRANGDLSGARDASLQADPEFQWEILLELRDWQAAARLQEGMIAENPAVGETNVEALGYAAALHRLAGNPSECKRRIETIQSLSKSNMGSDWYCAEALLINGYFDEALDLLREGNACAVFQMLCFQHRYREAFELVGVDYPGGFNTAWFQSVAEEMAAEAPEAKDHLRIAVHAARVLYGLGDRAQAVQAFALLANQVQGDRDGRRIRQICEAELRLGLTETALEHAASSLSKDSRPYALSVLFPNQSDRARVWWDYYRLTDGETPPRDRLERIWNLMGRPLKRASSNAHRSLDWQTEIQAAERYAQGLDPAQRTSWLVALAETCLGHGDRQQARRLFELTAESSADSALHVGDLWAEEEEWSAAARWYGQAWKMANPQPLGLYLQGQALIRAGQDEQGRRLCDIASLVPLASRARHALAKGMKQRGYAEAAAEQWRWILRTGPFRDWYVADAAKELGNAINGRDRLEAARLWESMLLSCLKTSSAFVKVEGYVQIPHLIHKTRARGLLAEGRLEEAVREVRLSHAAWPANVSLAEDMVVELEAAGCQAAADELFDSTFEHLQRLCDDFPRGATHHNNLAWVAARCDRRLDDALKHAIRAVQLAPKSSAYLDTLAEVHFRRGNLQDAIRCARQCLQADPDDRHYHEQMERFLAAKQTQRPTNGA
ncbi:MAG: tetratricopeptide repeat protein, partial [Pirellulaceae bacterium]